MEYLASIGLILISTLILGVLSQRIGMPAVVGEILAGLLLGPAVLHLVNLNHMVSVGSEIGVIFLMFIAGLECDFDLVKKYLKPAFSVAICGVILPVLAFTLYGQILGQGIEKALFWGVIFSATSVSISVEVLQEFGKLKSVAGATILGAAVVDDVISIVLLSIFSSVFGTGSGSKNLLVLFTWQILFFVLIILVIKWIAPWLMCLADMLPANSAVSVVGISICLLMAYLAEAANLSTVLGAFFAGIAIARTPLRDQVIKSANQVGYSFFIPIFFAAIGMEMSFKGAFSSTWIIVIVMTVLALLTKWIGCGIGAKLTGLTWNEANVVGSGMVSRGEMALIVAQIGLASHLLAPELYSEIIMVIVLSTILSPIMLKFSIKSV
ncbi:sodium hydrogen exchanger [Fructilactobacillus fructivorans]|uniref:cation:proton antiporter n=1 Tax=Fructilactobacillus fructivorans TaxID=1614 RepID=UPI000704BCF1|nr:cation:proton antiporter [Fructilactobacillus fructivorans]KRN12123.1 sodium hydrogen exchanger [Fructilactobacillus fructivorans]